MEVTYTFRDFDSKLEETFAGAEYECDVKRGDNDELTTLWVFVRHPRYPDCTATVEFPDDRPGMERSILPKRTITDRGDTPINAICEIAKFSEYLVRDPVQRQRGGRPAGKSEEAKRKRKQIAQDYWDTVGEYHELGERMITDKEFADSRGISVSTLRRALKENPDLKR